MLYSILQSLPFQVSEESVNELIICDLCLFLRCYHVLFYRVTLQRFKTVISSALWLIWLKCSKVRIEPFFIEMFLVFLVRAFPYIQLYSSRNFAPTLSFWLV